MAQENTRRQGTETDDRYFIIPTTEEISRREEVRPPCPKCEATNPISRGMAWRCRECGYQYLKIKRGQQRGRMSDGLGIKCPECGAQNPIGNGGNRYRCTECGKTWKR